MGLQPSFLNACEWIKKLFKLLCSHVKQSMLLIESMNVYIEEMIMTCVYIFPIEASNQSRFQREPSCLEVKSIEISPRD